ncbi:MAG: hypothetical protein ACK4ND_07245 [Cytophagaceae bacterium]
MIFRLDLLLWLIAPGFYCQINPGAYELYFYDHPEENRPIDNKNKFFMTPWPLSLPL